MDAVLWIIICLFACIGVAELAGRFWFMGRPRGKARPAYELITLYDGPAGVEAQLIRAINRMTWNGFTGYTILLDMGLGEDSLKVCRRLMPELYGSFLCTQEELPALLRTLDSGEEPGAVGTT